MSEALSPSGPLSLIDAGLRGMLVALLLLLVYAWRRDPPRSSAALVRMALALGLCIQAVGSAPWIEAHLPLAWQAPLIAVSVGNAVLFWVFVQSLFDDAFELRPRHVGAWLAVAALSAWNCSPIGRSSDAAALTLGVQRAVPALFALLAVAAAASQWRADLVEGRRRLRVFIVVSGVVYTLAMLAARLDAPRGQLSGLAATLDIAALLAITGGVAGGLLRLAPSELFPPAVAPGGTAQAQEREALAAGPAHRSTLAAASSSSASPAVAVPVAVEPDPAEDRLLEALQRAMAGERACSAEALSVGGLAARLGVPEYRLRRVINQRLGYRNFNAFVNSFRVEAARAALADPAQREVAVLTIALDAGFQSIGPFNRAFKAATGVTPSEFRRRTLADC